MMSELKNKLSNLAILSRRERFSILSILLTSKVLGLGKHSHSLDDLEKISGMSKEILVEHLTDLVSIELVIEKNFPDGIFYSITTEGENVISSTGLDEKKIKAMAR